MLCHMKLVLGDKVIFVMKNIIIIIVTYFSLTKVYINTAMLMLYVEDVAMYSSVPVNGYSYVCSHRFCKRRNI